MLASLARSLVAAAPMAALVAVAAARVDWTELAHLAFKAVWLAGTITAGLVAFAGAAAVLGGPEVEGLRDLIAARLRSRP